MKMNKGFLLAILLSVLHTIAAVIGILRLPEIVPAHFDINWVCDGMESKWVLLLVAVLPLLTSVLMCLFAARKAEKNPKIMSVTSLILTVFFGVTFWLIYPTAASGVQTGEQVDAQGFGTILSLMYALLFVILGNYLPVIQPNKYLGLKISWTLHNPQCWRVTHRFAGRLWVITGLLMSVLVLIAFLLHQGGKLWVYIVFAETMFVNLVIPCIYAYIHKDDGTETTNQT